MLIITVHDSVAGTWSNPVTALNEGSAKRDFATACADKRSLLGQHPTDFRLYAIADWLPSLDEGKLPIFRAYESPKFLMQGVSNDSEEGK